MEVILLSDVEKVGRKGDVLKVRDGFGRNYLFPRRLAIPATRASEQFVEEQKVRSAKKREKEKAAAGVQAEKLKGLKLVIEAKAGEQDKLFGSITAEDIAETLAKHGFKADKKHIHLSEPIRSLGGHTVTVEIYSQVKTSVNIEVIRKS